MNGSIEACLPQQALGGSWSMQHQMGVQRCQQAQGERPPACGEAAGNVQEQQLPKSGQPRVQPAGCTTSS
jgi:hypothetical protein